jgi:hypothetical protein
MTYIESLLTAAGIASVAAYLTPDIFLAYLNRNKQETDPMQHHEHHEHKPHYSTKNSALFILKLREDYSYGTTIENCDKKSVTTGMHTSSLLVSNMLSDAGIKSNLEVVVDNSSIDRVVALHRPTHVFIEGYWVVPEKFLELQRHHPTVKWIVRCHSEMPFLAQEGIAMDWSFDYWKNGVRIAANAPRIAGELNALDKTGQTDYLPNYYPLDPLLKQTILRRICTVINVGCFGAIRPLKNQLLQAVAAIKFANKHGLKLRFHINRGRVEGNGDNQLKNIRGLFAHLPEHELVEHAWTGHKEFVDLIRHMDICLQVSFTETQNICTCDAVSVGVPVVVSPEINWVEEPYADPTNSDNIVEIMEYVLNECNREAYVRWNKENIVKYSTASKKLWLEYLK